MKVSAKNVMKQKSFHKGIEQLVQEGAIQLYKNYQTGEYMLGAVGQLQFEVFKHRMEGEYNAEVVMSPMGKKTVRWIKPEDLDERMSSSRNILAKDRFDQPVFLFENDFALRWFADKYPDVELEEKNVNRYKWLATQSCYHLTVTAMAVYLNASLGKTHEWYRFVGFAVVT